MTVAALPSTASYVEDGVTVAFPAPFRFKAASDLIVERIVGGVPALLVLNVDYTVTGGATDAGGTVTRVAATTGATLRIRRRTARAQPMVYTNGDRFPAKSHEEALDRVTLIAQELDDAQLDTASRALRVRPGQSIDPMDLTQFIGKYLFVGPDAQLVPVSGGGADDALRSDLASLLAGAALIAFLQSGAGAVAETVQAQLRRVMYPQQFGAAADGATDDTHALNKLVLAAQASDADIFIPKGNYRARMWTVPRAGGGVSIRVHPEAVIKFYGPLTGTDSVLEVYADNTKVEGGIWDGGAPASTTTVGDNVVIKAFSGDAADPVLRNVVFNPTQVRNGNSHLMYIFGGKNCHVTGGHFSNAALNLIAFTAGNSAFAPEFDVPQEDCSIRNCFGDRTMNGATAQQGCFKFSQSGSEATARETNRCTIQNCTAHMVEQIVDTSGNVVLEIWGFGGAGGILNCRSVGGFIGLSIAKHQHAARIIGSYAIRAGYLNIEAASVTKSGISGCVSECDDFTPIGIALDFQNLLSYPGYDLTCEDCIVDQPQQTGILIVGMDPSPANTWRAFGAVVSGCTVRMKSTRANATGIRAVRVSDINITGGFIDGALASGFNAITIERAQHVAIDGIKVRQIPNVALQIIASGTGDTTDHIHVGTIFTDGTGVPVQFVTSGGTMGTNFSWGCYHGSSYLGVTNPGWTKLSPSGLDQSILSTGFCTGDPNVVGVSAGRGSILLSEDGNTYQRLAASPADDWAVLTGV